MHSRDSLVRFVYGPAPCTAVYPVPVLSIHLNVHAGQVGAVEYFVTKPARGWPRGDHDPLTKKEAKINHAIPPPALWVQQAKVAAPKPF